jgi:flavodoxin
MKVMNFYYIIMNNLKRNNMKQETLEQYLQRLKDRRTEDDYKYTDEDFEKYKQYISNCYKSGMSVYKCLEFMYFAEKDIDDQLFNRESKQETLEKLADKWVFETNGHKWSNNNNEAGDNFGSFIAGFKEAEKTLYSEEEVLNLLIECSKWQLPQTDEDLSKIKQWFEQFKNK